MSISNIQSSSNTIIVTNGSGPNVDINVNSNLVISNSIISASLNTGTLSVNGQSQVNGTSYIKNPLSSGKIGLSADSNNFSPYGIQLPNSFPTANNTLICTSTSGATAILDWGNSTGGGSISNIYGSANSITVTSGMGPNVGIAVTENLILSNLTIDGPNSTITNTAANGNDMHINAVVGVTTNNLYLAGQSIINDSVNFNINTSGSIVANTQSFNIINSLSNTNGFVAIRTQNSAFTSYPLILPNIQCPTNGFTLSGNVSGLLSWNPIVNSVAANNNTLTFSTNTGTVLVQVTDPLHIGQVNSNIVDCNIINCALTCYVSDLILNSNVGGTTAFMSTSNNIQSYLLKLPNALPVAVPQILSSDTLGNCSWLSPPVLSSGTLDVTYYSPTNGFSNIDSIVYWQIYGSIATVTFYPNSTPTLTADSIITVFEAGTLSGFPTFLTPAYSQFFPYYADTNNSSDFQIHPLYIQSTGSRYVQFLNGNAPNNTYPSGTSVELQPFTISYSVS